METFFKTVAYTMIAVVFYLVLKKRDQDFAVVLSVVICGVILVSAFYYLEQVISFVYRLQRIAQLDGQMLQILMKSVAIGITAQIAEMICKDSGNEALGKAVQFLASVVIIALSLPLMETLLELIGKVLGEQ